MSNRTRSFAIGFVVAVFLLLLLGAVATGAFVMGRNSATVAPDSAVREGAAPVKSVPLATPIPERRSDEPQSEKPRTEEATRIEREQTAEPEVPDPTTAREEMEAEPAESPSESAVITDTAAREPLQLTRDDLDLLLEVWELIDSEFDGDIPTEEEVIYSAINGSIELLDDRFTRFVPAQAAERAREQLEGGFEGIGAYVDMTEEGLLLIVRPIEGQPADLAGLKAGDIVTLVDGEAIRHKSLDEIVNLVRGPRGTDVTLTIQRESVLEPFDVTITRDLIVFPIVTSEMLDEDIAYLRLFSFSATASSQLEDAITLLIDQEPRGLILDLRDNPGGFLDQSVNVADMFLGDEIVLYQRDNTGEEEIFRSEEGDEAETIPLVVLVNAGSASASEIVAGAIQDHGRGLLVGGTTLGKGSVQRAYTLSDGSELRVTIARWFTPDNLSISDLGITPDIEVETPEEFGGETDTQLQRAIDYLLNGD